MEKKLRYSLRSSSAEEFLSAAVKLGLNSSTKSTLKSLIHSIPPSSPLSTSLPLSLRNSISTSLLSFHNLPEHSPPSKRPRHRDDHSREDASRFLSELRVLAHVTFLCVSHPKKPFSSSDLLSAAQLLHDNLVLFDPNSSLSSEVASLCENCWKLDFDGRETLISQSLPFLVSRSLTLKKKIDVHRVYALREAFTLLDFEDESIEDLKLLLIRCVIAPLYLKTEEGRRFLAFVFGLSAQLLKEALAMIKSQIAFGRKSILEAYGEILFRAWKDVDGDLKNEFENGFLQSLTEGAIYASSRGLSASIRRVLGGFITQRVTDGVEKLLFRLAEPVIFRSLQVANSNVRLNALHLLLDLFPLEDPDATKEDKDIVLEKEFFLLEKLLMDDCPDVRVVAVEGCCRVLHLFWEIIPSSTITKILTKIFDDMSNDICNEVRLSTLNGIVYLLGNPVSHGVLIVLLPRLGHLILDNVHSIRVAVLELLLLIRDIRTFQFNKVVTLEVLLSTLANDQPQVAQKVTKLLIPSYFPSKLSIEQACDRCITIIKRSPMAGARFCEYLASEGASLKSLMELLKLVISLVLSHAELEENQIEGLLAAAAHLCNNLLSEPCFKSALKEFLVGGKVKYLFAAAPTLRAQSAVLDMCSAVSPDDADELVEECMGLVTNCTGLPDNADMQNEVRCAHKLLMSCDYFDQMLEAQTALLQKTAYRCHVKFGTEIPKQRVSPGKRKKCKPSVKVAAKWKHVKGKRVSTLEEDYSVAVGIAWQIKDLLAFEDTRRQVLSSLTPELPLDALKIISEVSVVQCINYMYMDISPILAYTALALHMTLQNINTSTNVRGCEEIHSASIQKQLTVLDSAADHLVNCAEKLLGTGEAGESLTVKMNAHLTGEKHKCQADSSCSNDAACELSLGSHYTSEWRMRNMVKMLTAILKFIVESRSMGFLSRIHGRCLNFSSAYIKCIILAFGQQCRGNLNLKEDELKEIVACLRSSFSYAAKLLNLILRDTSEALPPPPEAFALVNDMLDLIVLTEKYQGSSVAGRLTAPAKFWLPDLVLALGSWCVLKQTDKESTHLTVFNRMKLNFPSWTSTLAKSELNEMDEVSPQEDDVSESQEFRVFKRFVEMIISLSKGNSNILDAIGVIFLTGSILGLERKDLELVLGLLHFVCAKLVGPEDREWSKLDMMLTLLPDIYPVIERQIEESNPGDECQKLQRARALLEPVWLYNLYETGRFSSMEE
ncbi:hypothetical protein K2173_014652 [Erythroxylum novogranatense]|uniref:Condensin-2 complex subunit G2 n=1 Tax=Erythroxylum novogranatense TaxID=1862640 RepID=A0AAV8TGX9_9ROSI|nr:hypothetical protein K2173_014652 [Erythroxylum novogranatense]